MGSRKMYGLWGVGKCIEKICVEYGAVYEILR